jgi:hypothetical protein
MMMVIMLTRLYSHILHKCNLEDHDYGTTKGKEANVISG